MSLIHVTKDNFAEVKASDKPVLLDFFATWCGPCRMIAPAVAKIAEKYEGQIKVGKIDVDTQPQLAARFGIVSIPTVKVFRGGQCTASLVGLRSKAELEALIR